MMARENSHDAIIDAAEEVVLEAGAAHMTLDAVARKAGLSKGGLIYNFPTKQALLEAMMQRHLDRIRSGRQRRVDKLPPRPTRNLEAYVQNAFELPPADQRSMTALLAAVSNDPHLSQLAADTLDEEERLCSAGCGLSPERVAVVTLAAQGLVLRQVIGVDRTDAPTRAKIMKELLRLVRPDRQVRKARKSS